MTVRFVLFPVVAACAAGAVTAALAQPFAATLPPIVVTGNPLGSASTAAPANVLQGDELVRRRGSSLADTLQGQAGVSSTYFGPNANRPIVRGLDGDRVRLLENGAASVDASSLSFDHAVPIDPLVVERVEVLRGPGALQYGGSAIGGVVQTLDNRIPRQRIEGLTGAAEVRVGGAEQERGGGALLESGDGPWAWHVDVFGRQTSDLRVPRHVPVEDGVAGQATTRVRNSAAETSGGAVGASYFFDRGHVGVALDRYDSRYGVVAEPDLRIRMQREQLRLASEVKPVQGPVRSWRVQLKGSRYGHREIDASGEVGTTFESDGTELRVEAEHAPLGALKGVIGLHVEDNDFSALGDEAFVPGTTTRKQALFVVEEWRSGAGVTSAGLRLERARIRSAGDADPAQPQFGPPMQRDFSLRSVSLGHVMPLGPAWSLSGSASLTERAPTSFELYANGVHAATGVYERGDTTLGKERGHNLDLAVEWKDGPHRWRLGAYTARFSRFISLEATGGDEIVEGEAVPLHVFRPVRARLHGLELEGRQRLWSQGLVVEATTRFDLARGRNADSDEALPRVAPRRLTLGLEARQGLWYAQAELDAVEAQTRVPRTDRRTAGHTRVNLSLSRRIEWGAARALWFLRAHNLGDRLAYSATTTASIRDLVPLPGRSIKTGLRVDF